MTDLSIIVLNYNTKEMTLDCLEALTQAELGTTTLQIIIVDNASSDGSLEAFNQFCTSHAQSQIDFTVIGNPENYGFAGGNNRGIRKAKGRYILLLNSDVIVHKDTLIKQITFMDEHPEYAVSTCKVVLQNGKLDHACHRGFPTPWASFSYFTKLEKLFGTTKLFGGYHQQWKSLDRVHDIDVISGAFFFARSDVFTKVGLLDEGFFMYAEDIDLCLRIRQSGQRIGFYPDVSVLHLKGASGRDKKKAGQTVSSKKTDYYFWDTMQLFYRKHYSTTYPAALMWAILKVIDWKKRRYV